MGHGWGGVAAQLRRDAAVFAQAGYLAVAFDYRGWGASDSRMAAAGPVREVVDPLDMTTDWLNVLHWVQAEPQCDTAHIGIWGSSFAGGHVVWVAARDPRVKAGYPAPRARVVGNLQGGPVYSKFLLYAPVEDVGKASECAMLFIIAEKEELFDNRDHGIKAYERAKGPKKLITIPGITHKASIRRPASKPRKWPWSGSISI